MLYLIFAHKQENNQSYHSFKQLKITNKNTQKYLKFYGDFTEKI